MKVKLNSMSVCIINLAFNFIFLALTNAAENDSSRIKFDLSVRYRFESWNGMNAKNYGNDHPEAIGSIKDNFLLQRVILGTTFNFSKKISASFHLQDSRAFGWSLRQKIYPDLFRINPLEAESHSYVMNPQEEFFEIYDLNIEHKELLKNLSVKLGRQKIFYGDYRIFGKAEFGNSGKWTWDAVKISYSKGSNYIDVFGGGIKINDPNKLAIPFTQIDHWGGGIYSHYNLLNKVCIEPFFALKAKGSTSTENIHSIHKYWVGVRLVNSEENNFIYDFLYTREFGNDKGKAINAYAHFFKIGYRFSFIPSAPVISLRHSFATGGSKNDNIVRSFDPVFGHNANFYGWMNIVSLSNLNNPEVVIELHPLNRKMYIEIKHNCLLIPSPAEAVFLNTIRIKDGYNLLGNETDVYIRYQPNRNWQFIALFGYFTPGKLEQINFKDPEKAYMMAFQVLFTY